MSAFTISYAKFPTISGYAASNLFSPMPIPAVNRDSNNMSENDLLVSRWLEKLLQHFGVGELDTSSEKKLAAMLTRCGESNLAALQNRTLLLDLKRKIVRVAGARLDNAFVAMSPDVIDEEDAEAVALRVAERTLQGLRYQGEIYRLTDSFEPCHRLQAFCMGQTLSEQRTAFIITQSAERFAVWVSVRAFPTRHHLSSAPTPSELGR